MSHLANLLKIEQTKKELRPQIAHVINPEMEIEMCRTKAAEFIQLLEKLDLNPSLEDSWIFLTRVKHYKGRSVVSWLPLGVGK